MTPDCGQSRPLASVVPRGVAGAATLTGSGAGASACGFGSGRPVAGSKTLGLGHFIDTLITRQGRRHVGLVRLEPLEGAVPGRELRRGMNDLVDLGDFGVEVGVGREQMSDGFVAFDAFRVLLLADVIRFVSGFGAVKTVFKERRGIFVFSRLAGRLGGLRGSA